MNILVLGNGFDLAHGLKTSYKNFLDAVEITDELIECEKATRIEIWNSYDKTKIPQCLCKELDRIKETKSYETIELNEFHTWCKNNFWFKYFKDKPEGTWIDFEKDIKEVCQSIEKRIYNNGVIRKLDEKIDIDEQFSEYAKYLISKEKIYNFESLLLVLEKDLQYVINSLDIYINKFINNEKCEEISPDIISLDIDKVISFNYSTTYQNSYNVAPNIEYDYIHGKAGEKRNGDHGNLVLGYDETKEKINEDMVSTLVSFKKYYQRVLNGTGNEYVKWVNEIQADLNKEHNVYFFGHSMDITDKDIIRDLILNTNVKTTIYFYSNQDKMGKLKNLVSVLGYECFIEYTRNGRIKFVNQQSFETKKYSSIYKSKLTIKNLYNIPYISEETYKSINEWFENLERYPSFYEIKYIYLAIDALQKYNVETAKVEKLKKICNEHLGSPYSYDDFLKDYAIYWGCKRKFENDGLEKLINEIFEKRTSSEKNRYNKFLEGIRFDGRTLRTISMGSTYLNIDLKNLKKVTNCFLDAFDKYRSYYKIYDEMVDFLNLIKPDLVKELLSLMLNESNLTNVRRNRIEILQLKYGR